jgi:hypothetical protein
VTGASAGPAHGPVAVPGTGTPGPGDADAARPVLRVVSGEPTPEELAALTVVLAAAASGGGAAPVAVRSTWADPARSVRVVFPAGPGAWRSSGLPR